MAAASPPSPWTARMTLRLNASAAIAPGAAAWRKADVETIGYFLSGVSPYTGNKRADQGARVAFNISSAWVPGFAKASSGGVGYMNRHDVAALGGRKPPPDSRSRIDDVLGAIANVPAADIYYGAVELNGAGVRYYGDICLILKPEATEADTLILDRNSFDLLNEPLRTSTHPKGTWDPAAAGVEARALSGRWGGCLHHLAACKILDGTPNAPRRTTIGAISEGVLADEDYIEVIRTSSFTARDLVEARTTAADVAVETRIRDRLFTGPTPTLAALAWRRQRRKAEAALKRAGVPVRVVVGSGRLKA